LCKNLAAKFPTILDDFSLGVDCIRPWVGGGGRQDGHFKFLRRKV